MVTVDEVDADCNIHCEHCTAPCSLYTFSCTVALRTTPAVLGDKDISMIQKGMADEKQ